VNAILTARRVLDDWSAGAQAMALLEAVQEQPY
jgi:hypothetical protein